MASSGRRVLGTVVRWTVGWATLGFVGGVIAMLLRAGPFVDSGYQGPWTVADSLTYAIWVPVFTILGSTFGLGLGTVFALLMILVERLWVPLAAESEPFARHVPRLLCGAAAGGLLGLPFGLGKALWFAILGVGSAASEAAALAWRSKRGRRPTPR